MCTATDKFLPETFKEGRVLLINKAPEWTSFDIVNKMRTLLKYKFGIKKIKIGHAGTLDPLAEGLLIICTGAFTKKIDSFQAFDKEYTGSFYLGATTPSYDLETTPNAIFPTAHITEESIREAAQKFEGDSLQVPPVFSAKKIDGQRAYEYARRGQDVKMRNNSIFIKLFEITHIEMPLVHFKIICSKGTYIRSVAHDFGAALGSGAYLNALKRTRIGDFYLKDAITMAMFEDMLAQ